jgi:hypothetical protein
MTTGGHRIAALCSRRSSPAAPAPPSRTRLPPQPPWPVPAPTPRATCIAYRVSLRMRDSATSVSAYRSSACWLCEPLRGCPACCHVGQAGASICPHGRMRYYCAQCGGPGMCEHGRQRRVCKEGCGGQALCVPPEEKVRLQGLQGPRPGAGAAASGAGGSGAAAPRKRKREEE